MSDQEFNTSNIPKGTYCYRREAEQTPFGNPKTTPCPYWIARIYTDGSETGYCSFLDEEDSILLWDQVKICGENLDEDSDFV